MATDISLEHFLERFGFDPFNQRGDNAQSQFDQQAAPYSGGADRSPIITPPMSPDSSQMPRVQDSQLPDPYQEGGPPPVQQTGFQPPQTGSSPGVLRKLVQMDVVRPLVELVQKQPQALGPHGQELADATRQGPAAFLNVYHGLLESDPEFQKQMVVYSQELSDRPLADDFGQPANPTPEEHLQSGVMAFHDQQRKDALRVGEAASTDLSRMTDLVDESVGKADGLNQKFRVDMVSLTGVARDKILKPLVTQGDLDGATKVDSLLDAMEKDVVGLASQGYHPNAIPLRIALQYRLELDKNPQLMEDTGYGKALRQMRGLFRQELDDKIARSAGLTQAVSPAEWRTSMNAYDQAFEIAKKTEPTTYRRRP